MPELPRDIKNIILDYYYSYKMYIAKQNLLRELRFSSFFHQVVGFYELFHTITLNIDVTTTPTPSSSNVMRFVESSNAMRFSFLSLKSMYFRDIVQTPPLPFFCSEKKSRYIFLWEKKSGGNLSQNQMHF